MSDPRNGQIRYVGKTVNMPNRLRQHIQWQKNAHLSNWIEQLKKEGLVPVMEEIEKCESANEKEWQDAEHFWIVTLRFYGFNLINLKGGGIGIASMAEETKQKISKAMKGRKPSQKTLDCVSLSKRGKKISASHLASLIKANTGRPPTQTQLIARGAIWRGKKLKKEHVDKMKAAWVIRKSRGNVFPPEVKVRLKAAWALRKSNPDYKHPAIPTETRLKIANTIKRNHALKLCTIQNRISVIPDQNRSIKELLYG